MTAVVETTSDTGAGRDPAVTRGGDRRRPRPGIGTLGEWRLAARLARRSVRRRPGRTLLVIAMLIVPVAAMTVASLNIRTEQATSEFARTYPGVDVIIYNPDRATVDRARAIDGAVVREVVEVYVPVQRDDGATARWTRILMPDDDAAGALLSHDTGRMPQTPGEVWMSTQVASALGARVGDTVTMTWPPVEWTVVGSGRAGFGESVVIAPGLDTTVFNDHAVRPRAFVSLPDGSDVEALLPVLQPPEGGLDYDSSAQGGTGTLQSLLLTWVGGTLGLAVVGIIVTAAFATSARRQLTTVGLLAANGATDATSRRSLALQGTWTGLIGAAVGIVAGIVLYVIASGPLQWMVFRRPSAPTRVSPGDLLLIAATATGVATVAALLPARGAARVPVLAALAGRRPEEPPRRALAPIGIASFLVGVALFGIAANAAAGHTSNGQTSSDGTIIAVVVMLAGVAVLGGTCACMPAVTNLAASLAARASRGWRLAARSVARSRSRSAAVITAVAVTVAIGTAAVVGATTIVDESSELFPPNVVELQPTRRALARELYDVDAEIAAGYLPAEAAEWPDDSTVWEPRPVTPALAARIAEIVPGATLHPRVIVGAEGTTGIDGDTYLAGAWDGIVVVDEWLADLVGLSPAERDRLAAAGAMWVMVHTWIVFDDGGGWQPASTLAVETSTGRHELPIAVRDEDVRRPEYTTYGGYFGTSSVSTTVLITPEAVQRLGLPTAINGAWLEAPSALTRTQRDQLADAIGLLDDEFAYAYVDAGSVLDTTRGWTMSTAAAFSIDSALVQAIVLAAATLILLIVVTIGLSLAAVESRDERDVLVTVGAKPRTLRRLAGQKATMFVATGAAIGVPVGLVPALVVLRVTHGRGVALPWPALAALLVVVPAVVGLVATTASGIAQRARPVLASNLAVD